MYVYRVCVLYMCIMYRISVCFCEEFMNKGNSFLNKYILNK